MHSSQFLFFAVHFPTPIISLIIWIRKEVSLVERQKDRKLTWDVARQSNRRANEKIIWNKEMKDKI